MKSLAICVVLIVLAVNSVRAQELSLCPCPDRGGSAIQWTVASGTGIDSDSFGTVILTNQSGNAIARSQPISGDFVIEVGARPDNTNIPANIYIVPTEHALDGGGPRLYISRSLGMDNSAITVSDGNFPLAGTKDTDATAPTRFFFARKGSVISIYRNAYSPTATPFYVSSQTHDTDIYLAVDNGGNIAETASKIAYRCRVFL